VEVWDAAESRAEKARGVMLHGTAVGLGQLETSGKLMQIINRL